MLPEVSKTDTRNIRTAAPARSIRAAARKIRAATMSIRTAFVMENLVNFFRATRSIWTGTRIVRTVIRASGQLTEAPVLKSTGIEPVNTRALLQ